MALDSREATPGKDAPYSTISLLTSTFPKGGQHDTNNNMSVATEGAARFVDGSPKDQPPPKPPVLRSISAPPRPF
jgi:hypothetical protein